MQLEKLREETEIELENLGTVAADANDLVLLAEKRPLTKPEIYGAAAMLGCFYTGVENLLLRFLKHQKLPLPTGEQWHDDLLGCFRAGGIPNFALKFDVDTLRILGDLRKIRHVVRNKYGHLLRWDLLMPHIRNLNNLLTPLATSARIALDGLEGKPGK
jgi:hypothetical protein